MASRPPRPSAPDRDRAALARIHAPFPANAASLMAEHRLAEAQPVVRRGGAALAPRARPIPAWIGFLASALLAGCAAGGPLVTPAAAPPEGAEQILVAADGGWLPASEWAPEGEPRAVLLALHGFGDHGESTFAAAADYWRGQGFMTIATDQRGFGRTSSRARWPGEDALIADAVAVSRQLRQRFLCTPLIVIGHSMGGGVVLAAAARGLEADGIVLAAPAIWGGKYLNPLHRALAWTAAAIIPDMRFTGEGIVEIQATDNMEALRQMQEDPLYLGQPSARELMGLVRVTDAAEAGASKVGIPALLLLGDKDQIVPNRTVEKVFAKLSGEREVIAYEEGWHLLFRDLQARNVWRDVAEWALRRTAQDCNGSETAGAEISSSSASAALAR